MERRSAVGGMDGRAGMVIKMAGGPDVLQHKMLVH